MSCVSQSTNAGFSQCCNLWPNKFLFHLNDLLFMTSNPTSRFSHNITSATHPASKYFATISEWVEENIVEWNTEKILYSKNKKNQLYTDITMSLSDLITCSCFQLNFLSHSFFPQYYNTNIFKCRVNKHILSVLHYDRGASVKMASLSLIIPAWKTNSYQMCCSH